MDPRFRWDDVAVFAGLRWNQIPENTNPPKGGFVGKALDDQPFGC
jgi:hypothetical protein